MKTNTKITNKKGGFTLIEVIAVLVLLGILAGVALPKYVDLSSNAANRALDAAVAELNGREALEWGDQVISSSGWADDATTFGSMDTALGSDYAWTVAATVSGGTLSFQSNTGVALTRAASTSSQPAVWSR